MLILLYKKTSSYFDLFLLTVLEILFKNNLRKEFITIVMCVMYHIIYSFSSDFVSNLKMAIRAETCS